MVQRPGAQAWGAADAETDAEALADAVTGAGVPVTVADGDAALDASRVGPSGGIDGAERVHATSMPAATTRFTGRT